MNVELVERTFNYGAQSWRVNSENKWKVYMWGWWPDSNGCPSGRYMPVATEKVPKELLAVANRKHSTRS